MSGYHNAMRRMGEESEGARREREIHELEQRFQEPAYEGPRPTPSGGPEGRKPSSVEETATGCVGADTYKDFARRHGYGQVEVLDWTSSAGDWQFIVSKDGERWRVLSQENNFPRPGFSHALGDEEYEGTAEEVLQALSAGY